MVGVVGKNGKNSSRFGEQSKLVSPFGETSCFPGKKSATVNRIHGRRIEGAYKRRENVVGYFFTFLW